MNKKLKKCTLLTLSAFACAAVGVGVAAASPKSIVKESSAAAKTVTYTVATKTTVSTSGAAPTGSSASYTQTYGTAKQATKDNSFTLTLSGFAGNKITGIKLSMHSNASAGAGTFSATSGTTNLAGISTATDFNKWYNNTSYGSTYRDVTVAMIDATHSIAEDESVTIQIAATANSLYCESYTITYASAAPVVEATGMEFNPTSLTIESGSTDSFTPSLTGGSGEYEQTITWTSSHPEILAAPADSEEGESVSVTPVLPASTESTVVTLTGTVVEPGSATNSIQITVNPVKEVSTVELIGALEKTEYYVGESISVDGLQLQVNYSDGTSKVVELTDSDVEYTINPETATSTELTSFEVYAIYKDGKDTTESYDITVSAEEVTLSLEANSAFAFVSGDSFNINNIKSLKASFSSGLPEETLITNGVIQEGLTGELSIEIRKDSTTLRTIEVGDEVTRELNDTKVYFVYSIREGSAAKTSSNCAVTVTWSLKQKTLIEQDSEISFKKVTASKTDWSGEYAITYITGNNAYCWTGIDANNCYESKTITDDTLTSVPSVTVTVASMTGGYSLKVNGGINNGKYMYNSVKYGGNGLGFSDVAVANTISFSESIITITNNGSTIKFNNASGTNRFRYYGSDQQSINLFEKSGKTHTLTDACVDACKAANDYLGGICGISEITAEQWAVVKSYFYDNGVFKFPETDRVALQKGTSVKQSNVHAEDFLAKYDVITSQVRYSGLEKFLTDRVPNVDSNKSTQIFDNTAIAIIIAISSILMISGVAVVLLTKKRKTSK